MGGKEIKRMATNRKRIGKRGTESGKDGTTWERIGKKSKDWEGHGNTKTIAKLWKTPSQASG